MVLKVDFERLAEEAKRHGCKPIAYLAKHGTHSVATVADPQGRLVIESESVADFEDCRRILTSEGLQVFHGRWVPDPLAGELRVEESFWVASVAYKSNEDKPGLWVHAFRGQPSVGDVLKMFYEELKQESGCADVSLDAFLSVAEPNVVILGPDEMESFAGSV